MKFSIIFIFKMKTTVIVSMLVIFSCLVSINSQSCSALCLNCTNFTSCSSCTGLSMLINNTYCAPCPWECNGCTRGANGLPVCSLCAENFQLDANNLCFQHCNPNCLTCTNFPSNCTTCSVGMNLTAGSNNTFRCSYVSSIKNCQI
jgi:hypothetical protein